VRRREEELPATVLEDKTFLAALEAHKQAGGAPLTARPPSRSMEKKRLSSTRFFTIVSALLVTALLSGLLLLLL
jgi:hypothetical protein